MKNTVGILLLLVFCWLMQLHRVSSTWHVENVPVHVLQCSFGGTPVLGHRSNSLWSCGDVTVHRNRLICFPWACLSWSISSHWKIFGHVVESGRACVCRHVGWQLLLLLLLCGRQHQTPPPNNVQFATEVLMHWVMQARPRRLYNAFVCLAFCSPLYLFPFSALLFRCQAVLCSGCVMLSRHCTALAPGPGWQEFFAFQL